MGNSLLNKGLILACIAIGVVLAIGAVKSLIDHRYGYFLIDAAIGTWDLIVGLGALRDVRRNG